MEQFKHLGFIGIFRECFKNIFQWNKTFLLISLLLLLPLSAMNLAQSKASELMFTRIIRNPNLGGYEDDGQWGAAQVGARYGFVSLWLFKVIYYTIYLLLSLVPTSFIATTIYAKREVTLKNAVSVVPKVLKRLLITFLWSLAIYFVYNAVFLGIFFIWFKYIWINSPAGVVLIVMFLILYIVTVGYMVMIWQLANAVSVLEDMSGMAALGKGEALMKGKKFSYAACFLVILSILAGVHFVFEFFVTMNVTSERLGTGVKVMIGIACFVVISMLEILRLVNNTVVYLVCKSVHREDIDLSTLHDEDLKGGVRVPTKRINV